MTNPNTSAEPVFNRVLFNTALFGSAPPCGDVLQVGEGLLYPALRKANITIGPQRTPAPAQFQDAIEELNRLIGSLNCDPLSKYAQDIQTFPLQKGKKTYTIGQDPQGCEIADFDYPRPQGISYANTILANSGIPLRFPLQLYTDQQWANVSLQDIGNTIPWALYYNRAHPIATMYLYGQPIADMQLELYLWHSIPTFSALTDVVILPPGYEDVLVLNLACRLAPHFQRALDPIVVAQARESLMRMESYNAPKPIAAVNGLCRGGDTTYTMIAGAGGGGGGPGLPDPTTTLGDIIVRGSANVTRLPIGLPGDVLTADPASWLGMGWRQPLSGAVSSVFGRTGAVMPQVGDYTVNMIPGALADPLIARGDIIVRNSTSATRLPLGADNQVLTADSSNVLGMRWATPTLPTVTSVFARQGAVSAEAGDYRADQITNAVDITQVYNDPPWINSLNWWKIVNVPDFVESVTSILPGTGLTGGGDLTQNRTLSVVNDTTIQRVQFARIGFVSGTRPQLNFIPGQNVTIGVIDNPAANRVDVTISSFGGSGGGMPQTPWLSDIDADGNALLNLSRITASAPGNTLSVTGNVDITGALLINGAPFALTPWTSNVDAANHDLHNVSTLSTSSLIFPQGGGAQWPNWMLYQSGTSFYLRDMANARFAIDIYAGNPGGVTINHILQANNDCFIFNRLGISTTQPISRLSLGQTTNVASRIALYETTTGANFYGIAMANRGGAVGGFGVGIYAGVNPLPTDTNWQMYVANNGVVDFISMPTVNGVPLPGQTPWTTSINGNNQWLSNVAVVTANNSVRTSWGVDLTGIWQNRVEWQVNGSKRWELIRWDDETGGNSGSNLYVNSYNDAGNFIAPVLAITRSNGNITASGSVSIGGALTMGGNINMNGRSINNVDQLNASGYVQASDANQRLQVLAGRLIYTNATGVRTFEISHQGLDMLGIIRFDNAGNPVTDGNVFNISRLDGTVSFRSANVQFINMRTTTPQAGSRELWADPADGYRVKWVP